MSSPGSIYRQRITDFSAFIARLTKPLRWIPWIRFSLFLIAGFALYHAVKNHSAWLSAGAALAFSGFLLAGWYDYLLKSRIRRLELLVLINRQEIAALEGDISLFDPGNRFMDSGHPYTRDLDVFGPSSLFQLVNRTATIFGTERLADYFSSAYEYREEIMERQHAVAEFACNIEFRQQLQLIFREQETSHNDLTALNGWLNGRDPLKWMKPLEIASCVLSAVTLGSIILSAAGSISYSLPVFMVLFQLLIVYAYGRRTMLAHQAVSSQVGILRKYAKAFSLAEDFPFTSGFNQRLKERLTSGAGASPGLVIGKLSKLLGLMDSNLNLLVTVIMNGLFMFNIHVLIAVERWRGKYRSLVPGWFAVLAELDAMASLGTFAFNHPHYTCPEPVMDGFQFIAEDMGHPLIPSETCVTNSLEIIGWNQFLIITGANMSGKSTFLRTVGANLLLAMTGAPVFAKSLIFSPIEIHSSIRTNDSLAKRESYFYAELRRLKQIISELEGGRRKLILLDEILKGTNSSDKQTGSLALIKQLMKYQLAGLFATHDLALGELVRQYPDNIRNLCFEIRITGEKMEIDYRISPGVCKNLNASFLMKNMGIILD